MLQVIRRWISRRPPSGVHADGGRSGSETVTPAQHIEQGNVYLQNSLWADASACFAQAVAADPRNAVAHLHLGFSLLEQNQYVDAAEVLARAAELQPDAADAAYLRGRALRGLARHEEAAVEFERAVTLDPQLVHAWCDLGSLRLARADGEGAVRAFEAALRVQPTLEAAKLGMADALLQQGRAADALRLAEEAVTAFPQEPAPELSRMNALHALGRLEEALHSSERVIALAPAEVAALHGRAAICLKMHRFAEAEHDLDAALRLIAAHDAAARAALLQARSIARIGQRRFEQAQQDAREALRLDPAAPLNWTAVASSLQSAGRYTEALATYEEALARHPADIQLQWDASLCRLLCGDMARGWDGHEARLRSPMYASVDAATGSAAPRWERGASVAGKAILLHGEQGLGDIIQFARYVPRVLRMGAEVVLQVPAPLLDLMRCLDTGRDPSSSRLRIVGNSLAPPAHAYRCSLLSLPAIFGTRLHDVPQEVPYFRLPDERCAAWGDRLEALGVRRPRVGLVWSGNPRHQNDHNRSLPLAQLLEAMPPGIDLVSLQPELRASDLSALQHDRRVRHFGAELSDFTDTGALITQLDLVISVDTSVAHLTGALAKPLWLLLPFNPDWRWMLERADTPWYPSCRIWRQASAGGWSSTLRQLRHAAEHWRAARAPSSA